MRTISIVLVLLFVVTSCNKDSKKKDYRIEIAADNIKTYEYETYDNNTVQRIDYNQPTFNHSWIGLNKNKIRVVATFNGTGTVTIYKEGKVIKTQSGSQIVNITQEVEP